MREHILADRSVEGFCVGIWNEINSQLLGKGSYVAVYVPWL